MRLIYKLSIVFIVLLLTSLILIFLFVVAVSVFRMG